MSLLFIARSETYIPRVYITWLVSMVIGARSLYISVECGPLRRESLSISFIRIPVSIPHHQQLVYADGASQYVLCDL